MSALAKRTLDTPKALALGRDRRRHRRIDLTLKGRFLWGDGDYPLETSDISCGGATIISAIEPPIGQLIVCYFDDFGRVNARVVRHGDLGFSVAFETSSRKRDKLADRLVWLLNAESLDLPDERDADRKTDVSSAIVSREDGSSLNCRLIDISFTGASFESKHGLPLVGEFVSAGKLYGEVVRVTPGEFAIRFLQHTIVEIDED